MKHHYDILGEHNGRLYRDGNRNNNKRVEERGEDNGNRVNQVYWDAMDDEGNGTRTETRLELKL